MPKRYSHVLITVVVIFVLDQVTKWWILDRMNFGDSIPIIPDYFNLTLILNPGVAFGMLGDWPDLPRRLTLGTVSVIALIVVIRFLTHEAKDDRLSQFALAGILGGALGNIVDRFRFDGVVDFLDFYVGTYHWPAFNVADSAITIGVSLLVFRFIFPAKTDNCGQMNKAGNTASVPV